MIKIVKKDAKVYGAFHADGSTTSWIKKVDTIKITPDWRPDNWNEIKHKICECTHPLLTTLEDCNSCSGSLKIEQVLQR